MMLSVLGRVPAPCGGCKFASIAAKGLKGTGHVYKEMWTPACCEVLEDFETFRCLFLEVLTILGN